MWHVEKQIENATDVLTVSRLQGELFESEKENLGLELRVWSKKEYESTFSTIINIDRQQTKNLEQTSLEGTIRSYP